MPVITKLATRDRMKDRIGTSEVTEDDRFDELLEVSTQIAVDLVGAEIRREAEVTLYPWGSPDRVSYLLIPRFPIESITSVKQAYLEPAEDDWSSITALVEHREYVVVDPGAGQAGNRGKLRRMYDTWLQLPHHIQVVGTFGFADPAEVPEGAIAPPVDLQESIVADAIMRWQHRNSAGYGSSELPGSVSELNPHPALKQACSRLRRWTLG